MGCIEDGHHQLKSTACRLTGGFIKTARKIKTAKEFMKTLEKTSPWFIHLGGLNIPDWKQVKTDSHQKEVPKMFPLATFSLWRLVKGVY